MRTVYTSKEFSHQAGELDVILLSLKEAASKVRLVKMAFDNILAECKGKVNKAHTLLMDGFLSDDVEQTQKYLRRLSDAMYSLSKTIERMDLYHGILREASTSVQNVVESLMETVQKEQTTAE